MVGLIDLLKGGHANQNTTKATVDNTEWIVLVVVNIHHARRHQQQRMYSTSCKRILQESSLTACISGWSEGCSASDWKNVKKAARRRRDFAHTSSLRDDYPPSPNALRLINSTTAVCALLLP